MKYNIHRKLLIVMGNNIILFILLIILYKFNQNMFLTLFKISS